jgi:hypothetical protein
MEIEKGEVIGKFYYSMMDMQTKAIDYVSRGLNDSDKVQRAKTLTELVQEIIKTVEETGMIEPPEDCPPPSYYDHGSKMCLMPRILTQPVGVD